MATSRDLFLSLLALDAYNRDYNTGLRDALKETNGTQIGEASVKITSGTTTAGQIQDRLDRFGTHTFSCRLTPLRGDSALRFQRHAPVSSHENACVPN